MIDPSEQTIFSHELRTPLIGLVGLADLLLYGDYVTEEGRQIVDNLRLDADYLLHLIDGMLWNSRETVQEDRECEIAPADFLDKIVAGLQQIASRKGLGFEVVCHDDVPERLLVQRNLLRQVLTNLIGNAIRYTDLGEVRVEMAFLTFGGDHLRFAVTDSGIGLDEAEIDRIFLPFVQVHGNKLRRGTGLGLWISRQLCERLGARLRVHSRKDYGSQFILDVPVLREGADAAAGQPSPVDEGGATPAAPIVSRRVLVIDDDPTNRLLLATILKSRDFQVSLAENGRIALDLIAELDEPFDLILTDIDMPVLDGQATARALREQGFQGFICGMSSGIDVEIGPDQGFDHFLPKPVDQQALFALLAEPDRA